MWYKIILVGVTIFYTLFTIGLPIAQWLVPDTNQWESNSIFLTFTYWNFVSQYVFFTLEMLEAFEHIIVPTSLRKTFLNIIFAPSVSILGYWILISAMEWGLLIPWYVDISIHGINIFLLIGIVVLKYPCIGSMNEQWQNYILPCILPFAYAIVVISYTTIAKRLIYPSNIFSFTPIEEKEPYGWVSILFISIGIPLPQIIFYYVCEYVNKKFYTSLQ